MPLGLLVLLGLTLVNSQNVCPAGHECKQNNNNNHKDANGVLFFEPCPLDSYSLQGWGRCCTRAQADACRGQAIGQDCTCFPMVCPASGQEPQRGPPGRFVCMDTPSACTVPSSCPERLFRETRTCNCLRLHPQTVVWGNPGGDYYEL